MLEGTTTLIIYLTTELRESKEGWDHLLSATQGFRHQENSDTSSYQGLGEKGKVRSEVCYVEQPILALTAA